MAFRGSVRRFPIKMRCPLGATCSRTTSSLSKHVYQSPIKAINPGFRQMSSLEVNVNKKLDGKIAIITGAAGAIGSVVSKLFAEHGAQVIVTDVSDENGHKLVSEIGNNTHYRHCDVAKEEDIAATVDFAVEKFGKLDIMFNNTGVGTPLESFETFDLDAYDQYNAINVRGVIAGIKHAARVMIPVKQGVILNNASIAATSTSASLPIGYNICKSSLPGLTRIAAYHLGKHGIRVNAISPHWILTPIVLDWLNTNGVNATFEIAEQAFLETSSLLGKRATEEDMAKGSLFLCSDDSSYVSGQNLVVDGGWCNSKEYDVAKIIMAKK